MSMPQIRGRRATIHARVSPIYMPTKEEWERAITNGWTTDGATGWPDSVCGVNCGQKGDLSYPPLPFVLHDFRWRNYGSKFEFSLSNVELRVYLTAWVLANAKHKHAWWVKLVSRITYWGVSSPIAKFMWNRIK